VSPAVAARLRLAALLLVGILLQTTVIPDVRVAGVCPDLMLLLAICAGLVGGAEQGAVIGFAAGLLTDLFLQTTPFGLSALAYCLIGFTVGTLRVTVLPDGWLTAPLVALAAGAAGVILFAVVGDTVGQTQLVFGGWASLGRTAVLVGGMAALAAIPVTRLTAWAAGATATDQGRQDPERAGLPR
jgi:rod shape-determining protein MreD